MQGKIYLVHESDDRPTLQAVSQQGYVNEDLLQAFLAQYPDLLAGVAAGAVC
jgi:hypothetical protein